MAKILDLIARARIKLGVSCHAPSSSVYNEAIMLTIKGEKKKIERELVGKTIRDFREKYRDALRFGILDSAPDIDVLLLVRELDVGVIASDESIRTWAERLGLRFVDASSFPHMLKEYLRHSEEVKT